MPTRVAAGGSIFREAKIPIESITAHKPGSSQSSSWGTNSQNTNVSNAATGKGWDELLGRPDRHVAARGWMSSACSG